MTGVDEHGQKIQRTAERQQLGPQALVVRQPLPTISGISDFRLLRSHHQPTPPGLVEQFYEQVRASGDIVASSNRLVLSIARNARRSSRSGVASSDHASLNGAMREPLRLSRYQSAIGGGSGRLIAPASRYGVRSRRPGLRDFSIPRVNVSGLLVPTPVLPSGLMPCWAV